MRSTSRVTVALLAALALWAAPATASSGSGGLPGFMAQPPPGVLDPRLAPRFAEAGPDGLVTAFVHFRQGIGYRQGVLAVERAGLSVGIDLPAGNLVYAFGSAGAFVEASQAPEVEFIEEAGTEPLLTETATWASRARTLYEPTGGLDLTVRDADGDLLDGSDVGVAIVDSGIDATHPDLDWAGLPGGSDQTVKNFKVVCTAPNLSDAGCAGGVVMTDVPDSDTTSGHGTHVAGIAAGTGEASDSDGSSSTTGDRMFRGVAPGAGLYGFGCGEGLSIIVPCAAASFQWIYDNGLAQSPPIRVVNNSWGGTGAHNPNLAISKLSDALVLDRDITVVFAAGNAGGDGSAIRTNPYANNDTSGVLNVANYDDDERGTRDNQLNESSSRGKADQPETWPDLAAPGSQIMSACKPDTVVCPLGAPIAYPPRYTLATGTSMAAPHVAGAVAILYQADPSISPGEVEDLLEDTAYKFTAGAPYTNDPLNPDDTSSFDKGHGLLDARAAVLERLGLPADPGGGSVPATTVIDAGDGGDHPNGALDLVEVTLSEPSDGTVVITWEVVDAEDFEGFEATTITYRLFSNVDGMARRLQVRWDGSEVTDGSDIPALSVGRSGNMFTAVYDAAALGAVRGAIHFDTWAASYAPAIQDRAPGDTGATFLTAPARGEEHVFVGVVSQPDLTVGPRDITFQPAGTKQFRVLAAIHNVGSAGASSVVVRFTDDDGTFIGEDVIASIPAGGVATAEALWNLATSASPHIVVVTVDPEGAIAEADETNNTASKKFAVRGGRP